MEKRLKSVITDQDNKGNLFKGHQKSQNVLILDDNFSIIRMLSKLLERMQYHVDYATTGEELISKFKESKLKQKKYDFLILDIVIPNGMSGDAALQEILKIDPSVKAIVSSGYSSNPIMSNYQDYGFVGVLPKPYTINDLKQTIQDYL